MAATATDVNGRQHKLTDLAWRARTHTPEQKLVLLHFATHADASGLVTLNLEKVMRETGLTLGGARKSIAALKLMRLLSDVSDSVPGFVYRVFPNEQVEHA